MVYVAISFLDQKILSDKVYHSLIKQKKFFFQAAWKVLSAIQTESQLELGRETSDECVHNTGLFGKPLVFI